MIDSVIILSLVVLFYARTLKYNLIIDDVNWYFGPVKEGNLKLFPNPKPAKYSLLNRIMLNMYGGGMFGFSDKAMVYDHLFSTLHHAANCILLYWAFGANMISFMAALFYAVLPANHQTAVWLNGRRYAYSATFVLLMILTGYWGIIFYPMALGLQMTALFAPLVYGPIGFCAMMLFFPCFIPMLIKKINKRRQIIDNDGHVFFYPRKIVVILKTWSAYLLHMVFPGRAYICYPFMDEWNLTKKGDKDAYALNAHFWISVIVAIASIVTAVILQGQLRWYFILMHLAILQWCGFITVTQWFTDRYVSVANIFMVYFLALIINAIGWIGPALILLIHYAHVTNQALRMYKSMPDCWEYHIFYNPSGVKCRELKAGNLILHKDYMGAWEVAKRGLELRPFDMKLNITAALCMKALGDPQQAMIYLREAKRYMYLGQENVIKKFERAFFGYDIDEEVKKINNKESKLERKQREMILEMHKFIQVN